MWCTLLDGASPLFGPLQHSLTWQASGSLYSLSLTLQHDARYSSSQHTCSFLKTKSSYRALINIVGQCVKMIRSLQTKVVKERRSVNIALGLGGEWWIECICYDNSLWHLAGGYHQSGLHSQESDNWTCSITFLSLGFLTTWWPRGGWPPHMVALAYKGKCPYEQRSCITSYDWTLDIKEHHFCWSSR